MEVLVNLKVNLPRSNDTKLFSVSLAKNEKICNHLAHTDDFYCAEQNTFYFFL